MDRAVGAGVDPTAIVGSAAHAMAERLGVDWGASPPLAPGATPEPPPECGSRSLGWVYERALDPERRHRQGVHYTPPEVAARLAALAIGADPAAVVCDPAVGGASFLLAAADHLVVLGVPAAEVVADRLWGLDLDPTAVGVARCASSLWAAEQGATPSVPDGRILCADTLVDGARPFGDTGFDVVIGNPPFQSQLGVGTARSVPRASALRRRWGSDAGPYADTAAWFLLAGLELARPGGRVLLVQPQSVLVATDVEPIRSSVLERARLEGLWWGGHGVFDAAVSVCAPLLRRTDPASTVSSGARVTRWVGPQVEEVADAAGPTAGWAPLVADLLGAPSVSLRGNGGVVGDIATATAGFRDEYYALTAHLVDDEHGDGPRLVTVGMIDPLHDRWGTDGFRIARRRRVHPRVDTAALGRAHDRTARWATDRLGPKVLVATQTKVVEAVVDVNGDMVPCTPVVAVHGDPDNLWHLAAALVCPVTTAVAFGRVAGAALSVDTIKLSARQVLDLPLPADRSAWDEGAAGARDAQMAADAAGRIAAMQRLGQAMNRAYGVDDDALLRGGSTVCLVAVDVPGSGG